MDIDFNSLRKQTCFAYDKLARKLNNSIEKDYSGDKEIRITPEEIQSVMDDLRGLIMTSAWTSDKDNKDFREVGTEVGEIAWFNENNEDDE